MSHRKTAQCDDFYRLHVAQRKEWTQKGVDKFQEDRKNGSLDKNWEKMDDEYNAFHSYDEKGEKVVKNPDGSYRNTKYIDRATGQYEVVLGPDGKVIHDDTNAGTFNYYSPYDALFGLSILAIKHKDYDVDPYTDFGNSEYDKTAYELRHSGFINSLFGDFKESQENARLKALRNLYLYRKRKNNEK